MQKNKSTLKKTLCIHCYFLQDFREMVCCQLNQQYSFSVNNFYELNLHQFHKDQQLLANHLMISTFAILNNNRSCVSIPIITWFHYRVAKQIDSRSTIHFQLSGFTGMTLKEGSILNFIHFQPFKLKYRIKLCILWKNGLSYSVITLQAHHTCTLRIRCLS